MTPPYPDWARAAASDSLWCEDETTRHHEGHVTVEAAWLQLFGEALDTRQAGEVYDEGDCTRYLFSDGRIYFNGCDGGEIRFLRQEGLEPALQGYECQGYGYLGKNHLQRARASACTWAGTATTVDGNCPRCLGAAFPKSLIYGHAFPGIWRRPPRPPLALPEPVTDALFEEVRGSLGVYWDYTGGVATPWLRFHPLETRALPFGLCLGWDFTLKPDKSNHEAIKDAVAQYLAEWLRARTPET